VNLTPYRKKNPEPIAANVSSDEFESKITTTYLNADIWALWS